MAEPEAIKNGTLPSQGGGETEATLPFPPKGGGVSLASQSPAEAIESPKPKQKSKNLPQFELTKTGVWYLDEEADALKWLCSHLEVIAMTRNSEGEEWGRLLAITDADGIVHKWAMPMSMTAGGGEEYRGTLKSMGQRMAPGRKAREWLDQYINMAKPEKRARCVNRGGWHDQQFVLPDVVYGPIQGEEVLLQGTTGEHSLKTSGSLEEWQENVGKPCRGNSRLVFAASVSLAATLLHPAGEASGGFNLVGNSSIGKSTSLLVSASLCGAPGYVRQWRATDNGLEGIAVAHCDLPLLLDEMGQIDGRTAGEIVYMLSNEMGKLRSKRDGTGRKPHKWRVLFLSTGEITLADKIAEDGRRRAKAGQNVRVVDIPADAGAGLGLFEDLHGFPDGDKFARHLKDVTARYYGMPLRAFLTAITSRDLADIAQGIKNDTRTFMAANLPPGCNGQVQRVCGRFALVAAAGEMGIGCGVIPWPEGEATKAAAKCFKAWLAQRGGNGAAEITAAIEQVRAFIESHGASRFQDWEKKTENGAEADEGKIINRAGFRRKDVLGDYEFFVLPGVFKSELCRGFNAQEIAKALKDRGVLLPGKDGKSAALHRVPGAGTVRLYHFPSSILGESS